MIQMNKHEIGDTRYSKIAKNSRFSKKEKAPEVAKLRNITRKVWDILCDEHFDLSTAQVAFSLSVEDRAFVNASLDILEKSGRIVIENGMIRRKT